MGRREEKRSDLKAQIEGHIGPSTDFSSRSGPSRLGSPAYGLLRRALPYDAYGRHVPIGRPQATLSNHLLPGRAQTPRGDRPREPSCKASVHSWRPPRTVVNASRVRPLNRSDLGLEKDKHSRVLENLLGHRSQLNGGVSAHGLYPGNKGVSSRMVGLQAQELHSRNLGHSVADLEKRTL